MRVSSLDGLIAAFGGTVPFGDAAGVGRTAVANWRARHGVPANRWSRIVAEARRRQIPGVTFEMLAEISGHSEAKAAPDGGRLADTAEEAAA